MAEKAESESGSETENSEEDSSEGDSKIDINDIIDSGTLYSKLE